MTITCQCPQCSQQFAAPPELAGQSAACPSCGSAITVPAAGLDLPANDPFASTPPAGTPPLPSRAAAAPAAVHEGKGARGIPWFQIRLGILLAILVVGGWRLAVDRSAAAATDRLYDLLESETSGKLTEALIEEDFGEPKYAVDEKFRRRVAYLFPRGMPWKPPFSVVIFYRRSSDSDPWVAQTSYRNDSTQLEHVIASAP